MEKFLGQWMPIDASEHGAELDRLLGIVHWLMLILFVVWGAYFIYALWRFNAKRNPQASYHGAQSHFSTYAEGGIAIVEDKYIPELNPNVAIEWGWMTGMGREVLYLREEGFDHERADWSGLINYTFEWKDPKKGIESAVTKFLPKRP